MEKPIPIEVDNAATLIANALATRLEQTGMQTFDLRLRMKSAIILFWQVGRNEGQKNEIQSVIRLLQNAPDMRIISDTTDGGSTSISLQETLLDRAKELGTL